MPKIPAGQSNVLLRLSAAASRQLAGDIGTRAVQVSLNA